jgi:hypothetical protein
MKTRAGAPVLALLLCGCDVDSTVGFNEGSAALVGGVRCPADAPLARCSREPCVVTNLFDAPLGTITIAVDSQSIFFLRDQVTLGRRSLDDGSIVDFASAESALMRMTIDENYVFWTELNGQVRGVPKAGGATFRAGYVFGNPTDIASDGNYLYWVLPSFGEVAMAPKPAGEASQIAGQGEPGAIAADATHAYWITAAGQLVRALSGNLASAEVIRSDLEAPVAVTTTDSAVYWASKNAVFRMPKAESTVVSTIASGFTEVKAIAAFGDSVYGVGMDGLWKVPATGGERQTLEPRPMSALTLACSGVYASGWFESAFIRYAP